MKFEKIRCHEVLTNKNDVQRFLRIMEDRLYTKSFPYYVAGMQDSDYVKLLKLTKVACLPTSETPTKCELCETEYHDVTEHIIMYCTSLNDVRNCMWDDMVNVLGVEDFVDLWSKPEEDILDIILGGRWRPLQNTQTRLEFLNVLSNYTDAFFESVQTNVKWLR
jgi:hypothetical protein